MVYTAQAYIYLEAKQIISSLHRRFPKTYTTPLVNLLAASLAPPPRVTASTLSSEIKEKDDSNRIARQRPILRVCAELALVHVIVDSPGTSGGEWILKVVKELASHSLYYDKPALMVSFQMSNDPSMSSMPLLGTFLKSFGQPYLGLQVGSENDQPDRANYRNALVQEHTRDRFKKMCEVYFDKVSKKLVAEYNVSTCQVGNRQSNE